VLGLTHLLNRMGLGAGLQKEYPEDLKTARVDWICGGAVMLPRRLMETLGHHDEHYLFYRDDPDIGMRLKSGGYEVWHCAETRVLHHHGKSTVKTPRKLRFAVIDARSRRHYHRKFHGRAASFGVECAYGLSFLMKGAKRALTGKFGEAGKQWTSFVLLFEAIRMPEEEKAAYEGYRAAPFNGLGEQPHGERAAPELAGTGSIAGGKS
jgi:GT2 family glycosyltransferase